MGVESVTMDDDLALLERFRAGDEAAFAELIERHRAGLYRVAYRMVGHADDALDLVQQSFVQLFMHAAGFRREAKLRTWLHQVLVNLCRNHRRWLARHPTAELDGAVDARPDERTPLAPLLERAVDERLQRAVDQLGERQRATLILRVHGQHSFEEIAEILDTHVGTARANYHFALRRLRRLLHEEETDDARSRAD